MGWNGGSSFQYVEDENQLGNATNHRKGMFIFLSLFAHNMSLFVNGYIQTMITRRLLTPLSFLPWSTPYRLEATSESCHFSRMQCLEITSVIDWEMASFCSKVYRRFRDVRWSADAWQLRGMDPRGKSCCDSWPEVYDFLDWRSCAPQQEPWDLENLGATSPIVDLIPAADAEFQAEVAPIALPQYSLWYTLLLCCSAVAGDIWSWLFDLGVFRAPGHGRATLTTSHALLCPNESHEIPPDWRIGQ